jgi:CorA-like Mg2+ transporter protein
MLDGGNIYELRRKIARIRSQAIVLRRFVAPDRDALGQMAQLEFDWISKEDRLHLREAADRFARMAEELEAVRERAALLHEQLTDLRAEMIDQRSLAIAVTAFIFLPLTFVTGLLGMNVAEIPFADHPMAFWGVVAFCVVIGAGVMAWFARRHWLEGYGTGSCNVPRETFSGSHCTPAQSCLTTPARSWQAPRGPSGCSSMVEQKLPKLTTRVRFPSPAPNLWICPKN